MLRLGNCFVLFALFLSNNVLAGTLSEAYSLCQAEKPAYYTLPGTPITCPVDDEVKVCAWTGTRTYQCLVFGENEPVHPRYWVHSWSSQGGSDSQYGDDILVGLTEWKGPMVVSSMTYDYTLTVAEDGSVIASMDGLAPDRGFPGSIDDICPIDGSTAETTANCPPPSPPPGGGNGGSSSGGGDGDCSVGNPCNPANGNKFQVENDYEGLIPLDRIYNSASRWDIESGLPSGWSHTFSSKLVTRTDLLGKTCLNAVPLTECEDWNLLYSIGNYYYRYDGRITKLSEAQITISVSNNLIREPNNSEIDALIFNDADEGMLLSISEWGEPPFRLDRASLGVWKVERKDGVTEVFDNAGRLLSLIDSGGKKLNLTYDGIRLTNVADDFGHIMSFEYSSIDGLISKVITPKFTEITYSTGTRTLEDPIWNEELIVYTTLETVTYPDGGIRTYHYDWFNTANRLSGITDENGDRYSNYAYDEYGRAVLSEHAGGYEKVTLSYDWTPNSDLDGNRTTAVTDANDNITYYTFEPTLNGLSVSSTSDNEGDEYFTRDAFSHTSSKTNKSGVVTDLTFDVDLLMQKTEDVGGPFERATRYEYHENKPRHPSLVESPSVNIGNYIRVITSYDSNDRPISITESGFTPSGEQITKTITISYNSLGLISSIDGPLPGASDVLSFTYYECNTGTECGQLHVVTNALGHDTTYNSYDLAGRPTKITGPNGLVTDIQYDLRGRVASVEKTPASGGSRLTSYKYDLAGQLIKITQPDGQYLSLAYDDAHNLIAVEDVMGNKISYSYNLNGRKSDEVIEGSGGQLKRTINYSYDALGRLQEIASGGSVTSLVYDAIGNLTDVTDAEWNMTVREYDSLSRLKIYYNALYDSTTYSYNVNDKLTSVISPNGAVTTYSYDDFGNLLEEQSPDRGNISYSYNESDLVTYKVDGRNVPTQYGYDVLGRITSVDYPQTGEGYQYYYDSCAYGVGKLCSVTGGNQSISYMYDQFGNVINQSNIYSGVSNFISYDYDSINQLTTITYPSGRTIQYYRDARGMIERVDSVYLGVAKNIIDNRVYRPDGNLQSQLYGNGIPEIRGFDGEGRISTITSETISYSYSYDGVGNLTNKQSSLDSIDYTYDELYRLVDESSSNHSYSYEFDGNGNRISTSDNILWEYLSFGYAQNSNKIVDIDNGTTVSYDASGNITGYSSPTKQWSAEYNQQNRLWRYYELGQLKAEYAYNYKGQRTSKSIYINGAVSEKSYYYYNRSGNLISETNGQGATIREYVWIDNVPIAFIDYVSSPSVEMYYIHTDYLNTPRILTDNGGNTVWRWGSDAFGVSEPEEDVDGDGTVVKLNLRYSGQYYDNESELHYNYYRYYDPQLGRFITSDPIGLQGGLNTYVYVLNNPIVYVDPLGLARRQVRPLDVPGLRNTTIGPLQHDRFQYVNGSDSGYYDDGTVRTDNAPQSLLNQYQDVGRWFEDNALRQAEQNVQNNGWFNDPYNLNPFNSHQCQDYADEVESEYDRITDRWVNTRRGRRERNGWRQQWWRP